MTEVALSPEKVATWKSKDIARLVTAAVELDREIKTKQEVLEAVKARLVEEGRAEFGKAHDKEADAFPDLAGTSWDFTGTDGCVASVSFPKDGMLRGGFYVVGEMGFKMVDKKPVAIGMVKELAGAAFNKLFNTFYKPKKSMEEVAAVLLTEKVDPKAKDSPTKAEALLRMVKEPQSPRVSFKTKG